MNLPETLKIGFKEYKVIFPHDFKYSETLLGTCEPGHDRIKIADKYKGNYLPSQIIGATLLHEVFHAVEHNHLEETMDHRFLTLLSNGLYQVIMDNEIFGDDLPRSVKVGGVIYDVKQLDAFDDEPNIDSFTDHMSLEILLATKSASGEEYSRSYKDMMLFTGVMYAIANIYCDYEDPSDSEIILISKGLYQAFLDNDLERVVRCV